MFTRMLVPFDGSALARRALPYAMRLASATRGSVILFHALLPVEPATVPAFDVYELARTLVESEPARAVGTPKSIEISALVRESYPEQVAGEICAAADNQRADSIVMSTHGRSGLGRWLYGGVADQVIRQSRVPVLLVSATCDHRWPEDAPLRILVPLDGSRMAEEVLGPVGDLAAVLRADLLLLGAAGPFDYAYSEGGPLTRSGFETAVGEVRAYLDSVADRLRAAGRTVEVDAEVGRAAPVIEAVARERKADLIAMATHGRSGIARLALGSVATETLQRATVPLLVTRPSGLHGQGDQESTPKQAGVTEPVGPPAGPRQRMER